MTKKPRQHIIWQYNVIPNYNLHNIAYFVFDLMKTNVEFAVMQMAVWFANICR